MARKTRSVKGGVTYFKRPYVLSYKDGSPTVYKIQICRGRVVKDADFIAYAANAAHVPESTMITARHAILEAINYFVLNGHNVQIEGLGSFAPAIRVKAVNNEQDVSDADIKKKLVRFNPAGEILDLCNVDNISFNENKSLTQQAMNAYAFRYRFEEGDTHVRYLVSDEGKLITGDFNGSGTANQILCIDDRFNPAADDPDQAGWHVVDSTLDLDEWGYENAVVTYVNKEVDGQIVRDHSIITCGHGVLKLSAGGTLSPQPVYEYVAPDGE